MSRLAAFLRSSIGKKIAMSLTGLALTGFLVVHLSGNLLLFAGDGGAAFNAYARGLHDRPWLLYPAEIGLAALFAVHIALALRTSMENRAARGASYRVRATRGQATWASRSMIASGAIVLIFLVVHLLDFRLSGEEPEELAGLVVSRLSTLPGTAIYLVGVGAVLFHLSHAARSALQTLGVNHPRYNALLRRASLALALVLGLGFAVFPIALGLFGKSLAATAQEAALGESGERAAPEATAKKDPR